MFVSKVLIALLIVCVVLFGQSWFFDSQLKPALINVIKPELIKVIYRCKARVKLEHRVRESKSV